MPESDAVARCLGVSVDYATTAGVVHALREVDAAFSRACVTVLAGPSGTGKSSLLRVLAGLQRPRAGRVDVDGVDLTRLRAGPLRRMRRRAMGVVLPEPAGNLVPYLRAVEQVELAARMRGAGSDDALASLERVGLADHARSYPAELSGGEQQRVAFAAAAIGAPTLLLADEPTAELDARAGARLIEALRSLAGEGSALVVASHDPAVLAAADHVVTLRDGRVAAA